MTGQQYSGDLVNEEYKKRMQGDYDWLNQNLGNWGDLNPNQQASVLSLVHNVGKTGFKNSKAFGHLGAGEFDLFQKEAFDPEIGFVKASRINPETNERERYTVEGLQNRRRYEQELFAGGYTPGSNYGDDPGIDEVEPSGPPSDPVQQTMDNYASVEDGFTTPKQEQNPGWANFFKKFNPWA